MSEKQQEIPEWARDPQPLKLPLAAIAKIEEVIANAQAPSLRLIEAAKRHGWRCSHPK